jgi:hypothetical protein
MASTPESEGHASPPNAKQEPTPPQPKRVVLQSVTGPPVPDMKAQVEESRRRHEADLAKAERLVAQARSGAPPEFQEPKSEPTPPPAPGEYRIEFDWRGETAYYVEHDRRVRLSCIYWGGPTGRLSHIHGAWEYPDGRREHLTGTERATVLRRVIDAAKKRENIRLELDGD